MLERIREGVQGPWAIGIVALIVVSFVFTGVGGYYLALRLPLLQLLMIPKYRTQA
jgi:hypothetical protein